MCILESFVVCMLAGVLARKVSDDITEATEDSSEDRNILHSQ